MLAFDAVAPHLLPQRLATDAEPRRRIRHRTLVRLQRRDDERALRDLELLAERLPARLPQSRVTRSAGVLAALAQRGTCTVMTLMR